MNTCIKRILSTCLVVALLFSQMTGLWGPVRVHAADTVINDIEQLGDWNHYNGIVFGNLTAYQADLEGAIAVGGEFADWGVKAGYDAGGSYYYYSSVHMGQYTNDEKYPTVLLGVNRLTVGHASHILGGAIVMTPALKAAHDLAGEQGGAQLTPYDGNAWHATASQELIDSWFAGIYRQVNAACAQFSAANDTSIPYADFASGAYFKQMDPADFVNTRLTYNGAVDETVLVVTVRSASVINAMSLPIDALWPQQYDLVVFEFPDAVNVTMSGDPQIISNSVISNKGWPDAHQTAAGVAEREALASNVIYSFPAARNINMTSVQLWGSLFAPDAAVSLNGGQINGQLICTDYTTQNSAELHARRWNRKLYDLLEDPEDELASVTLRKYLHYRADSEVPLAGARYELLIYEPETAGGAWLRSRQFYTTDADGTLTIEDLPYGRYQLDEVRAPDGFDLSAPGSTGLLEFELTAAHSEAALELTAYNEPLYTALDFHKVDSRDHDLPVVGAEFQLIRLPDEYDRFTEQGLSFPAVSGSDGLVRFESLPMGSYVLKELSAPGSYERMDDLHFDIIYREGEGLVAVQSGTDRPLSDLLGPELLLENEDDGAPDNWLSVFKYSSAADDADTAKGLAGARFHLYREVSDGVWELYHSGGEAVVIETDAAGYGHLEGLPDGSYRLVEITAPDGYLMRNLHSGGDAMPDYAASVVLDGRGDAAVVAEVANAPLTTGLTLRKLGRIGETESPLAGAAFSLYSLDAQDGEQLVVSVSTGADGTALFSGLGAGDYILRETAAPGGYHLLPDPIRLRVAFDETTGEATITHADDAVSDLVRLDEKARELEIVNLPHTGSLIVYKMARERYQNGTDWDENRSYAVTYLEGAVFQLQRQRDGFSGSYVDFGDTFTSSFSGYGTDAWGNRIAGAEIGGLPLGNYRLVEVSAPAGYLCDTEGGIVASFTITESMAEAEVVIEQDVTNLTDSPRSAIRVRKVDRASGAPLAGVEFKLWRIDDSDNPLTGREHIEEVMQNLMRYGQQKIDLGHPLVTGDDGWLELELDPGLYVLFEYEPADGYLYTLERGQTLERATDASFYHYTYLFRVVSMPDPADGVRIRWIDRYKLLDGEVTGFHVDDHDMDNAGWSADGFEEDDYRSFAITNRKESDLVAAVSLTKLDEEKQGLEGAAFTLTRAALKDEENPVYADGDYTETVGTYTSGSGGLVEITGLGAGAYRLTETAPPSGYALNGGSVDFRLEINGYSKMLDLLFDGTTYPGYAEPDSVYGQPSFVTAFSLGNLQNLPETMPTGDLTLLKRDADTGEPLEDALFRLYAWDAAADDWTELRTGLETGVGGLLTVSGLPAGRYKLVETSAPEGYQNEGLSLEFEMVAAGEEVVPLQTTGEWDGGRLVAENTAKPEPDDPLGDLTLLKRDTDTGEALEGAVFSLYEWVDNDWASYRTGLETDADGLLTIRGLPAGRYKLTETAPPEGYLDEGLSLEFEMVRDGDEVLPAQADGNWDRGRLVAENTAENESEPPTGELTLLKRDADTGEPLESAVFRLDVWAGADWSVLRSALETDASGLLTLAGLPAGRYRLVETAAPAGYLDANLTLEFEMVPDGENGDRVLPAQKDGAWDNGRLIAENTAEQTPTTPTGSLLLRKEDADSGEGLAGAAFSLYLLADKWDDDGTLLRTGLTTGSDGGLHIEELEPGLYRLVETAWPTGYLRETVSVFFEMALREDAVIPLLDGASLQDEPLIIPNAAEPEAPSGEVEIEKVDAATGKPLAGAVFDLYRGDEREPWRTGLTTGSDGKLTISGLEPGDYRLVETRAPAGYRLGGDSADFAMVLHDGEVLPDWQLPTGTADSWLLYRWEADEKEEEQAQPPNREEQEDEPETEEETDPEDTEEDPDEKTPDNSEAENGEGEPDAEPDPGESETPDEDDQTKPDDEQSDPKDDDPEPSTGESERGEDAQTQIPDPSVPLADETTASGGHWEPVSLLPYQADGNGQLLLRGLSAGNYKLVPAHGESDAAELLFTLEEAADVYRLTLPGKGDPVPLVIQNERDPDSPGGGGGGSGGGNGGSYGWEEPGPFRPRDPDSPNVPNGPDSPDSDGGVGGVGSLPGGTNDNPGTGAVGGAMLATGLGLAGAGGAYANRRTIRWWLHCLKTRRK